MEEENLQENLNAIEEEKKEYLTGEDVDNSEDEEEVEDEDVEVDEMEFSLTESEIDEWINELTKLKEEKGQIELSVDDENDLVIKYEESSDEEDSVEEGE